MWLKTVRARAMLIANYSVCIPIREIIRMKSVHSRFREQKAHKIRKRDLPVEIVCCHGPAIKALNCCVQNPECKDGSDLFFSMTGNEALKNMRQIWKR